MHLRTFSTAKKTLIFVLQSHVSTFLHVPFNVIFLASVTLKIYTVMNYRYIVGKEERGGGTSQSVQLDNK